MTGHAGSNRSGPLGSRRQSRRMQMQVIRRPATCPAWRCTPNPTPGKSACSAGRRAFALAASAGLDFRQDLDAAARRVQQPTRPRLPSENADARR